MIKIFLVDIKKLINLNDILHIPGNTFCNKIDKPWKLQFL